MIGIGELWHFWLREYNKIVPNWIKQPGLRLSKSAGIKLGSIEELRQNPRAVLTKGIGKKSIAGSRVHVYLDGPDVLVREVTLPQSGQKHSASALRLSLQKNSIVPISKLSWLNTMGAKTGKTISYTQLVAKTESLNEVFEICRSLKVQCLGIGVTGQEEFLATFPDEVSRAQVRWRMVNVALLLGAFLFWLSGAITEQRGLQAEQLDLNQQIETLRETAFALKAKQQQAAESAKDERKIFNQIQQGRGTVEILYILTKALPENTWISELSKVEGNVTISGFTQTDVSSLVANLESSKLIKDAELLGSVSSARNSNTKRFSLSLSLAEREDP